MRVEWREEFVTNVVWIDNQHRNIIHNIRTFVDAVSERKAAHEVRKAMSVLHELVENHFETEELYMDRHKYPAARPHLAQHANYRKVVEILMNEFEVAPESGEFPAKVQTVLLRYFDHHIPRFDRPLADFLRSRLSP